MKKYYNKIATELKITSEQVENTVLLLNQGATVPFVARYRKEVTGSLDELEITQIRDRMEKLEELDKRRETILNSIEEQGKLTDELEKQILEAESMTELEDIYLPYKPKRKTRATIAKAKGLEPLAKIIMSQKYDDPGRQAERFLNDEVKDTDEAIAGACDIIAEWINENHIRQK